MYSLRGLSSRQYLKLKFNLHLVASTQFRSTHKIKAHTAMQLNCSFDASIRKFDLLEHLQDQLSIVRSLITGL